jgi:hypothetical protein
MHIFFSASNYGEDEEDGGRRRNGDERNDPNFTPCREVRKHSQLALVTA